MNAADRWPALPLEAWRDTYATLHMWMQIVGKLTLPTTPLENHWWNVAFHLTPRGLATRALHTNARDITAEFDFVAHRLTFSCSDGRSESIPLEPQTVADFYAKVMDLLHRLEIRVHVWPMPVELDDPIRFDQDTVHRAYDRQWANACWRALASMWPVFEDFRARFVGKASPVHFFWGSFDLAATRFSGRPMPEPIADDAMMREAYSHECISHGWWPGGGPVREAMFYAYVKPQPAGFEKSRVEPAQARYLPEYQQFVLPYEAVRVAQSPEGALRAFLESTYEAAAKGAKWDRAALERKPSAG
jgi:hypothetical protein